MQKKKISLIIDQGKPNRTPLRTFVVLVRHGAFMAIIQIIIRKFITILRLGAHYLYRIPIKALQRIPVVSRLSKRRHLRVVLKTTYGLAGSAGDNLAIRVALVLRNGDTRPSSSAFIRLISPLTDPSLVNKFVIDIYPENTVAIRRGTQVCIAQRTAYDTLAQAVSLVEALTDNGIKLVIDTDDSFHSMDASHPEHSHHNEQLSALHYLLGAADEIWVSTDSLAKSYKQHSHKVVVIRNGQDERIWTGQTTRIHNGPLSLLYMGTATHDADMEMMLPALDAVQANRPGSFMLSVVGVSDALPDRPWISQLIPNRGTMYPDFVRWFVEQGPFDFGLSPLVDSKFNQAKSDIKCLDYIGAGVVPLVSDVLAYQSKELDEFVVRVPNNLADWEGALTSLIKDVASVRQLNKLRLTKGQHYIIEQRGSDKVAGQLYERLKQIVGA